MDFEEQNKFAAELEAFISRKLKGESFHAVIAVGDGYDNGFTYVVTTLSKRTPFDACDLTVTGIFEEAKQLLNQFKIPSNRKLKRPIEQK